MELPDIALSYAVTGTGNRLDASPTDAGENTGRLSVTLQPGAGAREEQAAITALRDRFEGLAGVQYQFSRPALFSFSSPLEVTITGYDLDRLRLAAEQVRLGMQASPTFSDIKSTVEAGNPEIQIVFDQERAAQLGIPVRELADRVVTSVRGDVATRYKLREKKIDVLVRSVDTRASSVEEIRSLIVNPGSERPLPLSAVAEVTVATGPAEIRRTRQQRVAIVSANLSARRPRVGRGRAQGDRRCRRNAGRRDRRRQRAERRHEGVVPLAAVHDAARGVPGLPGHGVAVRVAAAPVRDPADDPARAGGLGLGHVPDRHDRERGRVHRPHHAGRHRGQPVDRADRRGQPAAREGPGEARRDRRGGAPAAAPDRHHQAHHDPRPAADGHRPRRGRRDPQADGDHRDRRRGRGELLHAARDPGRLLAARPQAVPAGGRRRQACASRPGTPGAEP